MERPSNRLTFCKYGRSFQIRLENADDLERVLTLDESLWMANSAPLEAFVCDRAFLKFVDHDNNARIRCDEVRTAVRWLLRMMNQRDRIELQSDLLNLDDIDISHSEGQRVRAGAERILANLGKSGDRCISLAEVRDRQRILAAAEANGDGIIPPAGARDPETAEFIADILATLGGETDAGGKPGVTEALLNRFLSEAGALAAWRTRGAGLHGTDSPLAALGEDSAPAYAAWSGLREKIEEYFTLCAAAAWDPRTLESFRLPAMHAESSDLIKERLRGAPLAPVSAEGTLDLHGPINPAWAAAVDDFARRVVAPLLGAGTRGITAAQWAQVSAAFAPTARWHVEKPSSAVERLGPDKLERYLQPRLRQEVMALIRADRAVGDEIRAGAEVEKLALYQRWLLEFVNNFVSFPRFYDPKVRALFEIGTLVMDGRQFALNVRVADRAAHAQVARHARLFVAYIELTHVSTAERVQVATGVTSGGMGNIFVGKRGVFIWRDGSLWDAQVMQIIENPISLREAIALPFVRIGTLLQAQVEKFAGAGEKLLEGRITKTGDQMAADVRTTGIPSTITPAKAPAARPAASPAGNARDLLMGGSVAIGVLGSSFAYIAKTFSDVDKRGTMILVILSLFAALVLLVVLPTILIAWIKLRMRDVGALLEASGWAINGRMRLTRTMQKVFTRRPGLPPEARKDRLDQLARYAEYAARPIVRVFQQEGPDGG